MGQPPVFFGIVTGPGIHDAKAIAPYLPGPDTRCVQKSRAQGVYGVGNDADQPLVPGAPGKPGKMADKALIGFQLGHAHVSRCRKRWYAFAGTEDEDVAVKELLFRNDMDGRQDGAVPLCGKGIAYLVDFYFQPG